MRKKVGWIWIIGAVLLFISDFLTFGNQSFSTVAWAGIVSSTVSFIICPILLFIGVAILFLGKDK